jgi:hypothetical protein
MADEAPRQQAQLHQPLNSLTTGKTTPMKRKKSRSLGISDKRCHRCNEHLEAREHTALTDKQLTQPFYYRRWFQCVNDQCSTTLVMFEEDKVVNKNAAAKISKTAQETIEQYGQFKDDLADRLQSLF